MTVTPGCWLTTLLCRTAASVDLNDVERKWLAFLGLTRDVCPAQLPKLSAFGLAAAAELANGMKVCLPAAISSGGDLISETYQ